MDRIQRLLTGMGGGGAQSGPPADTPQVDTAEQIYISSLALIKMLKHGEMHEGLRGTAGLIFIIAPSVWVVLCLLGQGGWGARPLARMPQHA